MPMMSGAEALQTVLGKSTGEELPFSDDDDDECTAEELKDRMAQFLSGNPQLVRDILVAAERVCAVGAAACKSLLHAPISGGPAHRFKYGRSCSRG